MPNYTVSNFDPKRKMPKPFMLISLLLLSFACFSQDNIKTGLFKKVSSDSAASMIKGLTKELSLKHPGFYRYTTKEKFDAYIDSILKTMPDSVNELDIYRK